MIDPMKKAGARFPFENGDLVFWERDWRILTAYTLYTPLHDVLPEPGFPAKKLAAVNTPGNFRDDRRHLIAAASELIPISAFGVRVISLKRGITGAGCIRFKRNDGQPVTATNSRGRALSWQRDVPLYDGNNYFTSCPAEIADFIEPRLIATNQIARAA